MTGLRHKWVELLCFGMGLPLLLALVLTGGGLSQRTCFDCVQDSSGRWPAADDPVVDRDGEPEASVDLAGWRIFIHAATPEVPSLSPEAAEPCPGAICSMPGWRTPSPTGTSAGQRFYRPQAPPFRA
jgi:hypothetical protein